MTARHTSDHEFCYACERLLASHEEVYCGPCGEQALASWPEPSDAQLAQRDALIERGWRELAAVLAGIAVGLLVLVSGLTHDARAHDTGLTRVVDGRTLTWPAIGTEAYTRSCEIVRAWEDGSAEAYCAEDGAFMVYDPELNTWYNATETR